MLISIIMPVYNENNQELRQSIKSMLNQTYNNFELIIIDDNPDSYRIKCLLKLFSLKDNRIRVVYNSKNIGTSKSSNKGVMLSKGKYIAKMDADDICNNKRLQLQLNFLRNNHLDLTCSNFCGFNGRNINSPYFGETNITNQFKIKKILRHYNIAMGPTLFFRKASFIKVNGYRNILVEDYDLVIRFIVKGYLVGYQSLPLLYKRNRITNLSNNNGLKEYLITYLLSKNIRFNGYTDILSENYLNKKLNNITYCDINKFKRFKYNLNLYKETKSFKALFSCIVSTLSSKIVLKRNLWIFINRHLYKMG